MNHTHSFDQHTQTHYHDPIHFHHDHDDHHHDHDHHHGNRGIIGTIGAALHLPGFGHDHSHESLAADSAIHDNELGIRTIWIALFALSITTVLQVIVYISSGSVALLADTVHNLGDALNSVPLLIAFYLARRLPTRRFTYGFGRFEDIAGIFIVGSIAFSAGYILWESVQKLINPQPLTHLGWVAGAALIGFVGNEIVASMQIRVGQQIGSDMMIADGQHARVDGLMSLAVLIAVIGTWAGFPIIDPIVGLLMGIGIANITRKAIISLWYRLMDAVDPELLHRMEHAAIEVDGVEKVISLKGRWVGHRLYADLTVEMQPALTLTEIHTIQSEIHHLMQHAAPQLNELMVNTIPSMGAAGLRGDVE